jgi:hypothetical protein
MKPILFNQRPEDRQREAHVLKALAKALGLEIRQTDKAEDRDGLDGIITAGTVGGVEVKCRNYPSTRFSTVPVETSKVAKLRAAGPGSLLVVRWDDRTAHVLTLAQLERGTPGTVGYTISDRGQQDTDPCVHVPLAGASTFRAPLPPHLDGRKG